MQSQVLLSLEQVAECLGLSCAVIKRLSQSMSLPKAYYTPNTGKIPMMAYSMPELDCLQEAKALLLQGHSIADARTLLHDKVADNIVATHVENDLETASDPPSLSLQRYEQDDLLKKQLSDRAMATYRHQMKPRPFSNLSKLLSHLPQKDLPLSTETYPNLRELSPLAALLKTSASAFEFPMATSQSVSPEIIRRVKALQAEMGFQTSFNTEQSLEKCLAPQRNG